MCNASTVAARTLKKRRIANFLFQARVVGMDCDMLTGQKLQLTI